MRIFERALCAGRDIRSRLAIGPKDSSVGVKAVEHARRLKGGLAGKTVFVLGAGVVAQSVVVELCQEGAHCGIVATKTFARAAALAGEHGCTALRFEDFYSALSRADIVFGTSASPHLLLSADCFQKYSVPGREMLLIDLAVPRDIDPAIGMARGATLLTVDDIVSVPSEDIRAQAGQMAEQKARLFWGREGYDTQGGMSTEPARQDPGR
jgi:glutamyl-tRNA reductase